MMYCYVSISREREKERERESKYSAFSFDNYDSLAKHFLYYFY